MDQDKASIAFLLHKNLAMIVIMVVCLIMQYYPPHGWSEMDVIIFFLVSQFSFFGGVLTNLRFNGYGVHQQVNKIAGGAVVPNFGITWRGFAIKPLARSWTYSVIMNTALAAVAAYFVLFSEGGPLVSAGANAFIAYASAKLLALAGEIYVWMMADRHRHWYLVEERLMQFLVSNQRPQTAIDNVLSRARAAQLLITRVRKF